MAAKASPTSTATAVAAGVRTPGTGVFSDPAQVGAMIQSMYPQYRNMDATTLGQRWIAVHTPAPASGGGVGTGGATDLLQAPNGGMDTMQPGDQKVLSSSAPDLSGLAKFAKPVQAKPQPQANVPLNVPNLGQGINGNALGMSSNGNPNPSTNSNNTPWLGSQIATAWNNFWKPATQLQQDTASIKPLNQLYGR